MKGFVSILVLTLSTLSYGQIDFIGIWESYYVFPHKENKEEILNAENIKSTLTLVSDSSFTLVTTGQVRIFGYYTVHSNSIQFYKSIDFNRQEHLWVVEWPEGDLDPYPPTEEIDLIMPIKCEVKVLKSGEIIEKPVFCLYMKKN